MTHKALIKQLETTCLGLDPIDPLRLLVDDVIEALREHAMREVQRLGQEIEQEPVAWGFQNTAITGSNRWMMLREKVPSNDQYGGALWTPLFTTPPQRTEQEPVVYWKEHAQGLQRDYDSLLADFQAQRTWVGLTDEDAEEVWQSVQTRDFHDCVQPFAKAIEAKLRQKNHVAQETNS